MVPEAVAALAGHAAPWLLTYLLHSTILVAVAWLVERAGVVRGARTLDVLWKTALVSGFATSSLSVVRAANPRRPEVREVRAVVRHGSAAGIGPSWSPEDAPSAVRIEGNVVTRPSTRCASLLRDLGSSGEGDLHAVWAACAPGARLRWPEALVLLWVAGAVGLGAGAVLSRQRLSALLGSREPPGPRVAAAVARLGGTGGARAEVMVSSSVQVPCAVERRVLLPARCEAELTEGELVGVLAHELAHVARRDPAWLSVADTVCRLAWVQPLNRVAAAGLRGAAELVCDEQALRHVRPLELARSLHQVSAWALPGQTTPTVAGLALGAQDPLGRRVRRILARSARRPTGSTWGGVAWTAALVGGTLLLPPVPRASEVRAVFVARVAPSGKLEGSGDATTVHVVLRDRAGGGTARASR